MHSTVKARTLFLIFILSLSSSLLMGQSVVRGTVIEKENNFSLIGVTIVIKGTGEGTASDFDGNYELTTDEALPFTLVFSSVGMRTEEFVIDKATTVLDVKMIEEGITGTEVVVSASRVEESIMEAPSAVEKLDAIAIKQAATFDFYDALQNLKGVYANQSSLNFTSINTRGFASVGNTRFVQLVDGMDVSSPMLNFPMGNVAGNSELDFKSMELLPGAASSLYGPNAFNGLLLIHTKNPFDSEGLSAQVRTGVTYADAVGRPEAIYGASLRYAKKINEKFAFKFNASLLEGKDWRANDYTNDRKTDAPGNRNTPDFDGVNIYGDEFDIVVNFPAYANDIAVNLAPILADSAGISANLLETSIRETVKSWDPLKVTRTGYREDDLIDKPVSRGLSANLQLNHRITEDSEVYYQYVIASGSSVYQGDERYALRNFIQQYHKVGFESKRFKGLAYTGITNGGDSYNLTALGSYLNEKFAPSQEEWVPNYVGAYSGYLMGLLLQQDSITDVRRQEAHDYAREFADAGIPEVGSEEFIQAREEVRNGLFQQGGASFSDRSRFYHAELNYILTDEIQIGGSFRRFNLFSNGTVLNEDPEGTGMPQRIRFNEVGFYLQFIHKFFDEQLKLITSFRVDKSQNLNTIISERAALVFSPGKNKAHNFRLSTQTGFRNPQTQAQYIYFPTGLEILLGSTPANAERYGIHRGGAWSKQSYDKFVRSRIQGEPDSTLLKVMNIPYVKPEKLFAWEFGYKAMVTPRLFVDIGYFRNSYRDFLSITKVVNREETEHRGEIIEVGTPFNLYTNISQKVVSHGANIGVNYRFPRSFYLEGSYSFTEIPGLSPDSNTQLGFNTPRNRYTISFSKRKIWNRASFNLTYRWSERFLWESGFDTGVVPAQKILDAQVSYEIPKQKIVFKLGANNLFGKDYRSFAGGPWVGQKYFVSMTYNN